MRPNKNAYKRSSFGPAFFFLSRRRREALADYYEFCRLMDDIVDEPDCVDPQAELAYWELEIRRVYDGNPQTDLGKRLKKDIQAFLLPQDRFLLLIEGMRADLEGRLYSSEQALEWYLYRVAVIVGAATLDILGIKGKEADQLARWEGMAVQLTNIIRDVPEDSRRGRVYLPDDLLVRFGLTRKDVLENRSPRAVAEVLKVMAGRAEVFYQKAFLQMGKFNRLKMIPCRVMGYVYLKNLAKIKKTGFIFTCPVKLTKGEKITGMIYALFQTFF